MFLLLNGPNLNFLGLRNTKVYGTLTLEQIVRGLQKDAESLGCEIFPLQSNHEGVLIDNIQQAAKNGFGGIIFNPGGYTHTSVALRDAVEIARDLGVPTVEIHITDITQREPFRQKSFLSEQPSVVVDTVMGYGHMGYGVALRKLIGHILENALPKQP